MISTLCPRLSSQYGALLLCTAATLLAYPAITAVDPPEAAAATTYHIQSRTSARATQHLRSDTTFATPRVFSQSLTLSAHDLRGQGEADVNARLSIRYSTDLGLQQRLRQDPLFDARWNDLSLDLAYIEWRPYSGLQMSAGRQWHRSPLGITDFDGLAVSVRTTGEEWSPFFGIAAGRDVQRGLTPWDPGAWDVQGLPPNEAVLADRWHWMAAATAGVASDQRHRAELAAEHHRRPRGDGSPDAATTQRFGASTTVSPSDPLTLTTTASFHSTIDGIDRVHLDAAYRLGEGVVTTGIDHRQPIFDSSSIFNLFGAQPHRSAYATYRRPLMALATTVEIRSWTRLYFDENAGLFDAGDERAVGAALVNHHRLQWGIPFELSWQISAQTMTGQSGGDQYLGDARVRAPGPMDGLFLTGRMLGLWAATSHHRRNSGYAATGVVGAELEVGEMGQLSVHVENRMGSQTRANTALFALFELETWR